MRTPKEFSICHCDGVEVGTYDNQVSMKSPYVQRNAGWVCIDTCIATEVGWLWHQGVWTLNSCCGHGLFPSWVVVAEESYDRMTDLGYVFEVVPGGVRSWRLRTGTSVDPSALHGPGQ